MAPIVPAAALLVCALGRALGGEASRPPEPTYADVAYGEHPRQKLDFWKAASEKPTPVLFYLHGGGWTHGDKRDVWKRGLTDLLDEGISVVSINYRYVPQARDSGVNPPVKWPMGDASRALQFVRSKAGGWNIDKNRIAASGTSAGACSALWIALHDDMADPESDDPVARESTRVECVAVFHAQTSLDPVQMREWTPNSRYGGHAFGIRGSGSSQFESFHEGRKEILPWIREYSPYAQASGDDPPVYLLYKSGPALGQEQKDPTHSANFGVKLQERLKDLGVDCELNYPGAKGLKHASVEDYLIKKLGQ